MLLPPANNSAMPQKMDQMGQFASTDNVKSLGTVPNLHVADDPEMQAIS